MLHLNDQQMSACGLTEMEPGPMPIIPKALWAEIHEWLLAWKWAEGMAAPGGLLLHGPTGSGKTSLARAILKHMGGRQGLLLEAHHVLSSLFSESSTRVAKAFAEAGRVGAMLVVEEIDALGTKRGEGPANHQERNNITIALMRCMEAATMPVVATTNFKGALDAALLRRFDVTLEVPGADEKARRHILTKILGEPASDELVALPLVESIRLAQRMRRQAFIAKLEAGGKR